MDPPAHSIQQLNFKMQQSSTAIFPFKLQEPPLKTPVALLEDLFVGIPALLLVPEAGRIYELSHVSAVPSLPGSARSLPVLPAVGLPQSPESIFASGVRGPFLGEALRCSCGSWRVRRALT